jgi:hypothetical protein
MDTDEHRSVMRRLIVLTSVFIRVHLWTITALRPPCVSASLRLTILLAVFATGCSVPNLEPASCTGSRGDIREFYSFHFGNDMSFSPENLKLREKFLTPEFSARLASAAQVGTDPFTTGTEDLPKTFRVGECTEISPSRTSLQILLFWRDETRTEQREIKIETVKQADKWLVDKVEQKHGQ